jgi:hypothetical protein
VEIAMRNSLLKPVLVGSGIGALVGFLLLYVSAAAFADSESTTLAQIIFPYALVFDPRVLDNPWTVLGLALIQFPLYGIILTVAWPRTRRVIPFVACMAILIGAHFISMREAHVARAAWRETLVKWE